MPVANSVDISSLTNHQRVLNVWRIVIVAGLLIFVILFVLSYFVLDEPTIVHNALSYKRAESSLGFSELGGLVLSAIALLRYTNVKNKYHKRVFNQLVADNDWTPKNKFSLSKVPAILLGAGEYYEQDFGFDGSFKGHDFRCLIFEYITSDAKTRRFICLSFNLPKPYPMIVIDNKRNDHMYRHYGSDLPNRIPNGVELSLEGFFNNYYRVSVTKGYEQETLEVLTPEFMATLEDHVSDKVDIEINDKNLFLIFEADYYSGENVISLFSMSDAVLSKLGKPSGTWLASRKGQPSAVTKSAAAARYKLIYRTDWISAIAFLLIYAVFIGLIISHV